MQTAANTRKILCRDMFVRVLASVLLLFVAGATPISAVAQANADSNMASTCCCCSGAHGHAATCSMRAHHLAAAVLGNYPLFTAPGCQCAHNTASVSTAVALACPMPALQTPQQILISKSLRQNIVGLSDDYSQGNPRAPPIS